jgi:hypothetical protein
MAILLVNSPHDFESVLNDGTKNWTESQGNVVMGASCVGNNDASKRLAVNYSIGVLSRWKIFVFSLHWNRLPRGVIPPEDSGILNPTYKLPSLRSLTCVGLGLATRLIEIGSIALPRGVIGNTSDSGSEESRFEP